jgi:hypothetical protein
MKENEKGVEMMSNIKPGAKCKLRTQCKYAMGNIRQFCRKRKNMSVRHYTG